MEARLRKRSAPVTALELQRLALVHSRERSPQCAQCCTGEEGEVEGSPSGREASARECRTCMLYTVTEQLALYTVTEQLTLYTTAEELTFFLHPGLVHWDLTLAIFPVQARYNVQWTP